MLRNGGSSLSQFCCAAVVRILTPYCARHMIPAVAWNNSWSNVTRLLLRAAESVWWPGRWSEHSSWHNPCKMSAGICPVVSLLRVLPISRHFEKKQSTSYPCCRPFFFCNELFGNRSCLEAEEGEGAILENRLFMFLIVSRYFVLVFLLSVAATLMRHI